MLVSGRVKLKSSVDLNEGREESRYKPPFISEISLLRDPDATLRIS